MNLRSIPSRATILIDANIVLYATQRASEQCIELLHRCAKDDVSGVLPMHILAEIMHQLMLAESRHLGWAKGPNPSRRLSEKPDRIRSLWRYEELMQQIFRLGFQFDALRKEDFLLAIMVQKHAGLMTNDALLVATGHRLGIKGIASADQSFSRAAGMLLYSPDDICSPPPS